jgi:hypothetical protein
MHGLKNLNITLSHLLSFTILISYREMHWHQKFALYAVILQCVIVFPLAVQAQTVQVPGPAMAQQQATTAVAASVPQMMPAPAPERAIVPVVSMAPAPTPMPLQTALPIPSNIQQCTPLAPTVASPNMIVTSAIPQIQSVSPQQQAPQVQPQLQTQVSTAEEDLTLFIPMCYLIQGIRIIQCNTFLLLIYTYKVVQI